MAGPLSDVAVSLGEAFDLDNAAHHAVGRAVKELIVDELVADVGGDQRMSGWRRSPKLNTGYELTGAGIDVNVWPAGLWTVLEDGRRGGGRIVPRRARRRRRGRRPAVSTPQGPRYSARITSSRPKGTLSRVEGRLDATVITSLAEHLSEKLGKIAR